MKPEGEGVQGDANSKVVATELPTSIRVHIFTPYATEAGPGSLGLPVGPDGLCSSFVLILPYVLFLCFGIGMLNLCLNIFGAYHLLSEFIGVHSSKFDVSLSKDLTLYFHIILKPFQL